MYIHGTKQNYAILCASICEKKQNNRPISVYLNNVPETEATNQPNE